MRQLEKCGRVAASTRPFLPTYTLENFWQAACPHTLVKDLINLKKNIVVMVRHRWQQAKWSSEIAKIVFNLFPDYTDADVARVIYYALHVQSTKHKIRNQGAWEQLAGVNTAHKLHAVRAVSGQSECSIHDPLRFAVLAPISMKSHIAGLFHITEVEHLSSILSKGLVPGGDKEHNGSELTFTLWPSHHSKQITWIIAELSYPRS
jgi:hypothetical protein